MHSAVWQDTRMASDLLDLRGLLVSWQRAMRAEHKSAATIKTYSAGVAAFLLWCEATGVDAVVDKATTQQFIADLLDGGAEPATAHARHKALRRFSAWLVTEGEFDADPLLGAKPPQ